MGIVVEEAFRTARQYRESGFVREGEPQFSDVTVTVVTGADAPPEEFTC